MNTKVVCLTAVAWALYLGIAELGRSNGDYHSTLLTVAGLAFMFLLGRFSAQAPAQKKTTSVVE
jgi:hypothetical protein